MRIFIALLCGILEKTSEKELLLLRTKVIIHEVFPYCLWNFFEKIVLDRGRFCVALSQLGIGKVYLVNLNDVMLSQQRLSFSNLRYYNLPWHNVELDAIIN